MAPRDLDQMLHHLEEHAENELSFLADTGAEYFSTAQLIRLKGQWQVKHDLFQQFSTLLVRVIATSPIWLILWMAASAMHWPLLGICFLVLFPLSFLVFVLGQFFLRFAFRGNGHLEEIGKMIDQELENRRTNRKSAR